MTLCIISHTEHYRDATGKIVGWGSTVREINHLLDIAEHIIHVAPLHTEKAPASSLAYADERIQFVPLKPSGGKGIQKTSILWNAFFNLKQIHKYTTKADFIQFRAPTGIGLYVLPYLRLFRNKNYWVKYAGNWVDGHMPLGNKLQKLFLLNCISKNTKVTYNGNWVKQNNFLSFENPCLTLDEYQDGKASILHKKDPSIQGWQLCFVGSLTTHKGIQLILESLKELEKQKKLSYIKSLHIVGEGPLLNRLVEESKQIKIPVVFHGFLAKTAVNNLLKQSHALLLPSKSEGFPKVLAEAMNYGCIPVVTDVSCIAEVIDDNINGILIQYPDTTNVVKSLKKLENWSFEKFIKAIDYNYNKTKKYTYSIYNQALIERVISVRTR